MIFLHEKDFTYYLFVLFCKVILQSAKPRKYGDFHQQMLTADSKAIDFYRKCVFEKAGSTQSMWIYQGDEHNE